MLPISSVVRLTSPEVESQTAFTLKSAVEEISMKMMVGMIRAAVLSSYAGNVDIEVDIVTFVVVFIEGKSYVFTA